MILTITMDPSVDIAYSMNHLNMYAVNRVDNVFKTPGGKGLNVTRVLAQIGDNVQATGLLGGELGDFLEAGLDNLYIKHSFYKISGEIRNCIAILHEGKQTEIFEQGPEITDTEAEEFLVHFKTLIPSEGVVVISGSLPKGISPDYYSKMVTICEDASIPVVVDCSGVVLEKVLNGPNKPTVIKPNIEELSQLLGVEVSDNTEILKSVLTDNLFKGVEWVIVSLGANGAFAKHWNKFYKVNIPKIDVVNPVGSGDSTVAGIASSLAAGKDDEELLRTANVLGMLNAQESQTGHVNLNNFEEINNQIEKEKTHLPQIEYKCCAIEDVEFPEESFDVILSSLAFHYVADYEILVTQLSQLNCPNKPLI